MTRRNKDSNWQDLKDRLRKSFDKVVEFTGSYPVVADEMGLAGAGIAVPAPQKEKRRKRSVNAKPVIARRATPARTPWRRM